MDPGELLMVRDRVRFRWLTGPDLDDLDLAGVRAVVAASRELDAAMAALRVRLGERAIAIQTEVEAHRAAGIGSTDCAAAMEATVSQTGSDLGAVLAFLGTAVPAREAERDLRRVRIAHQLPHLGTALREGRTTGEHLDVVHRISSGLDDATRRILASHDAGITRDAATQPAERFARSLRRRLDRIAADAGVEKARRQRAASSLRSWVDAEGMGNLRLELDPEWFEMAMNAIEAECRSMARQGMDDVGEDGEQPVRLGAHLQARAFVELLGNHLGPGSVRGRPGRPSISVVVDAATLTEGSHGRGVSQTARGSDLSDETIQRLACDATIRRIVLGPGTVPLDVGRLHRTATDAQWAAITAVYSTCCWAGCNRPITWTEAHHIIPWQAGGPTDLANLVPLCSHHHHLVHEGRWAIRLDADRTLHIHLPDGTLFATTRPDRIPPDALRPSDRPAPTPRLRPRGDPRRS